MCIRDSFSLDYDTELVPLGSDRAGRAPIRTGEHLYAQTLRTFRYLRERADALPEMEQHAPSFGREARHHLRS